MKLWILILIALFSINFVSAQTEDVLIEDDVIAMPAQEAAPMHFEKELGAPGSFVFISSLFEMGDKIVKGAPYSADSVTERVQTLSDGNRIVHKNSSQVFRDSAGRIRREQEFGMIGNWVSAESPQRHIFINDPVEGVHYVLEPENQIARKMKLIEKKKIRISDKESPHHEEEDIILAPAPATAIHKKIRMKLDSQNAKKESLGKQMIEGLEAEGTRYTTVIPAGEIGNERAIEMVTEKWYSSELKVYLMTRHNDPRFGETIYRLTNVKRGEPDPSLFQVPSNYKIEEGAGLRKFHKKLD